MFSTFWGATTLIIRLLLHHFKLIAPQPRMKGPGVIKLDGSGSTDQLIQHIYVPIFF
jgi:hypothetical protein